MAYWRLASSLLTLRNQVNRYAPLRSKVSDGTIGDQAHQNRSSDHNPDGGNVVRAIDLTHDPAGGLDAGALAASLIASRDPRIKYIIWNRRIMSQLVAPWQWRPYGGSNAHTKHIHVSILGTSTADKDTRPWAMPGRPTLRVGAEGEPVKQLQTLLGITSDGVFGPKTEAAVRTYQAANGLTSDGIVGPRTWDSLLTPKVVPPVVMPPAPPQPPNTHGAPMNILIASHTYDGYWLADRYGRVKACGDAPHFGDLTSMALNAPIVDGAGTAAGYYLLGSDGGVFAFGDARFAGSLAGVTLNAPARKITPTQSGYWIIAEDGGVFAFGDAPYHGNGLV